MIKNENNNVFNIVQYKTQNPKKLKLLQIYISINYDYGLSTIITDEEINLNDKIELIKLYIECDRDKYTYKIASSPDINIKEKLGLIKVYKELKYDDGKLDLSLEEKLITMMECVKHDKESYTFKILSNDKLSTEKKIRLKKHYEKYILESSKELVYCN